MRKNLGLKIFGFFTLAVLMVAGTFGAATQTAKAADDGEATGNFYHLVIRDEADLFSDWEEQELAEKAAPILEYGHVAVYTVASGGNSYGSTATLTDEWYGRDFGYKVNGVALTIDMDERNIYLYSCGELESKITVNDCNAITDNIYSYASDGNYYRTAAEGLEQVYTRLESGAIARPMMTILVVLLAIYVSFVIMYLVVRGVMTIKKPSVTELANAGTASVSASDATAVLTGTSRRYSPVSSGSSGGGGGHGGGGGGGGGHGGGHSF